MVRVGDLGSGSDYTPFIQHLGVPSTDIGSDGPYGVYHSAFDNYNWFIRNADPTFVYEQQQARVFGLEILHMADTEVLPYDDKSYGAEIVSYLGTARRQAEAKHLQLNFAASETAAHRFEQAGTAMLAQQQSGTANAGRAEPGTARRGDGAAERRRSAPANLVQAHHLCAGGVHGLRGRGDPRRDRGDL